MLHENFQSNSQNIYDTPNFFGVPPPLFHRHPAPPRHLAFSPSLFIVVVLQYRYCPSISLPLLLVTPPSSPINTLLYFYKTIANHISLFVYFDKDIYKCGCRKQMWGWKKQLSIIGLPCFIRRYYRNNCKINILRILY